MRHSRKSKREMKTSRDLLDFIIELCDGYKLEVDPENYLREKINASQFSDEEEFLAVEIFSGMAQFKSILRKISELLFSLEANFFKKDRTKLEVIGYLCIFNAEVADLIFQWLGTLKQEQGIAFLDIFLEESYLKKLKNGWIRIMDKQFVEQKLIQPIKNSRRIYQGIQQRLIKKSQSNGTFIKKAPTKPVPFSRNLNKSVPLEKEEEVYESRTFRTSIPATTYETPENLRGSFVREKEHERLVRIQEKTKESDLNAFSCAYVDKSDKTKERMRLIFVEEQRKLDFNRKFAQPSPDFPEPKNKNKENAASILRAGEIITKKETENLRKLEILLQGGADDLPFTEWQEKMLEKDREEQENRLEENILDAKLSREMAVLNHLKEIQRKHDLADDLRREWQELLEEKSAKTAKERKIIAQRIQEIIEANKNLANIRERLEQEKHKIAAEIRQHREELFAEKAQREAAEMEAKKQLISKIKDFQRRALEDRQYKLQVDLISSAGHGLLDEMSIVELQERLSILREELKRKEEEKREEIGKIKSDREDLLAQTMEKIAIYQKAKKQERDFANSTRNSSVKRTYCKSARAKDLESRLAAARAQRSQLC
ncbi:Oidioi.mRNA.OKI2018_I69.chr1.g881.t1.cds [Oikopleura dioica]|uniref:Oidioi.mRNA.OKI2018_I69.chr1.g881.t1.cds n=1 Tax=Oikopleura dioica TaxID=34765 RepID=A0ABN7SRG9_OIKDI|nr:Oidioi.mRNA.OKI2018_I69.chr1.g881.t1.cds [Oikopleura dioica]